MEKRLLTDPVVTEPGGFSCILQHIAYCLVALCVFFAIFSTSAVYLLSLPVFLVLCIRVLRARCAIVFRWLPVWLGLLYLALVLLGIVGTPAVFSDISKELLVVALPVITFPLLLPLFTSSQSRSILLYALILSAVCVGVRTVLLHFGWIPDSWSDFFMLRQRYVQQAATLMALGIYLLLFKAKLVETKAAKITFCVLAIALFLILLAAQVERVGMVLALLAPIIFFLQQRRCRKWLPVLLVVMGVLGWLAHEFSPNTQGRIRDTIRSVRTIHSLPNTSLGLRVHSNMAAFGVIKEKPMWGYGTGTFAYKNKSTPTPQKSSADWIMINKRKPEMGSAFVLLRHGVIGLVALCALLLAWWLKSRQISVQDSRLVFASMFILLLADCSYPAFYHSRAWIWLIAVWLISMGRGLQQSLRSIR